MKATFTAENKEEIITISHSKEMAIALWEIKVNMWRKWKHKGTLTIEEMNEEIDNIIGDIPIESMT